MKPFQLQEHWVEVTILTIASHVTLSKTTLLHTVQTGNTSKEDGLLVGLDGGSFLV